MERVKEGEGEGEGEGKEKEERSFHSSPLPPPSFFFWALAPFSVQTNTENPVPRSFFASKPDGNACCAG